MSAAPRTVTVRLPEDMLPAIEKGLDIFSRLKMGQFEILVEEARFGALRQRGGAQPNEEALEAATHLVGVLKEVLLGFPTNASHGIYSKHVDTVAVDAWSISKAVRNYRAWSRNPQGGISVVYDEPLGLDREAEVVVSTESEEALLARLPEGVFVTRQNDRWLAAVPSDGAHPNQGLRLIASSSKLPILVQKVLGELARTTTH